MLQKAYTEWGLASDDDCLADSQTSCWTTPQPRMNRDQAESRAERREGSENASGCLFWLCVLSRSFSLSLAYACVVPLGLCLPFSIFQLKCTAAQLKIKPSDACHCRGKCLPSVCCSPAPYCCCCCSCCSKWSAINGQVVVLVAVAESPHRSQLALRQHMAQSTFCPLSSRVVLCLVALGQTSVGFYVLLSLSLLSDTRRTFSIKKRLAGQYFGFCLPYVFCLPGHAYGHLFFLPGECIIYHSQSCWVAQWEEI